MPMVISASHLGRVVWAATRILLDPTAIRTTVPLRRCCVSQPVMAPGRSGPAFSLHPEGGLPWVQPRSEQVRSARSRVFADQGAEGPTDGDLSRRSFLRRGFFGCGGGRTGERRPRAPRASHPGKFGRPPRLMTPPPTRTGADAASLSEPLVVHVKDIQSGEMNLYLGEREIAYRDPQLASRILRATR